MSKFQQPKRLEDITNPLPAKKEAEQAKIVEVV
jgi:hypothetical protein